MRLLEIEQTYIGNILGKIDDQYIPEIREKCSDIINLYNVYKKVFYHRTKKYSEIVYSEYTPWTRIPKNSSIHTHDFFNYGLSLIGIKENRNNGIFASSDLDLAEGYGEPYIIFPQNGFKYSFFANEPDSIVVMRNIIPTLLSWLEENHSELNAKIKSELNASQMYLEPLFYSYFMNPENKNITKEFFEYYLKLKGLHLNKNIEIALKNNDEIIFHNAKCWFIKY